MTDQKIVGLTGLRNIIESSGQALEQVLRQSLGEVIMKFMNLEASQYMEPWRELVGPDGRRLVRRSGTLPERELSTGLGPIRIRQPRVRDGREGHKFTSAILPPCPRGLPAWTPWFRCCISRESRPET